METIMNDNDSKAFLKEMARVCPKYKDNFGAVSNLIVLLMEELQKERKGRKRGEKYKQIVEDMRKLLKPLDGMTITYTAGDFLKEMNFLQQKYFPKER